MTKEKDKKFLELGKKLTNFYETGYFDKKQTLMWSFLKGLAAGFGAFLGGTIVIALVLWLLSLFDSVPLIDSLRQSLQQGR